MSEEHKDYLNSGDVSKCYGCRACAEICPQKCISMIEKSDTFIYPEIDKSKCVSCGLCSKVCPANAPTYNKPIKAIVAVHKNEELVLKSASGGAFSVVCELLNDEKTVVFGVVMDGLKVKHSYSDTGSASDFRKSKYVQSDTNGCFSKVRDFLLKDKKVIFSGTPCQVMALKNFLRGIDTGNLFTIDIVCHGVPSQKMFDLYIEGIAKKNGAVKEITFKNKKAVSGEINSRTSEIIYIDGNSTIENTATDPFLKAYYSRLDYRSSCLSCQFARMERVSDITLGDAWGIERKYVELSPLKGTSLVIANTENGMNLLGKLGEKMNVYPVSIEEAINTNGQLKHPTEKHSKRDKFIKLLEKCTFEEAVKRALHISIFKRVLNRMKRLAKNLTK